MDMHPMPVRPPYMPESGGPRLPLSPPPRRAGRRPPRHVGSGEWRKRTWTSRGASLTLHAMLLVIMLGLPQSQPIKTPPPPPSEPIEVEFIEIPAVKPAVATAPQPAPVVAEAPVPPAPVIKPVPKPAEAAAPKPAAQQVAKPQPARIAARPVPDKPQANPVPIKKAPTAADLAKLAAARRKASDEEVADRLAALQKGSQTANPAPEAPAKAAGRPIVSHNSPLGELSGRGILAAPVPNYPLEARRKVWEGKVLVRVYVNAAGGVTRAAVENSSGFPALDAAAAQSAAAYRFTPLADGEGVEQSGVIPFTFVIE